MFQVIISQSDSMTFSLGHTNLKGEEKCYIHFCIDQFFAQFCTLSRYTLHLNIRSMRILWSWFHMVLLRFGWHSIFGMCAQSFGKVVSVQGAHEVLHVCILLTLIWLCQRYQCLRYMGMEKPFLVRLKEMAKPSTGPEMQLPLALWLLFGTVSL